MDDIILKVIGTYGLLSILVTFLVVLFIMWMIKKSVKNALVEVIDEDALYDNIKYSVAEGVLLALEQYNNGKQNERPTE